VTSRANAIQSIDSGARRRLARILDAPVLCVRSTAFNSGGILAAASETHIVKTLLLREGLVNTVLPTEI
jgi:hypothetical protein